MYSHDVQGSKNGEILLGVNKIVLSIIKNVENEFKILYFTKPLMDYNHIWHLINVYYSASTHLIS